MSSFLWSDIMFFWFDASCIAFVPTIIKQYYKVIGDLKWRFVKS